MKMKKIINGINLIVVFCLMVAAAIVLAVSSVTTIYYEMHSDNDQPLYGSENIPLLALFVVGVLLVFFLIYRIGLFKISRLFAVAGILFVTAYCLMLILAIHPQAVNDSKTLDDIINSFAAGDYSSLTQPGGYLFIWPFQLGYVAFGQLMVSLFGQSNYFAWDLLQLICIQVTMVLIYLITREIFEDEKVAGMAMLMSFGALFFYNYVTYIYGDIISMLPQTLALYLMVRFVKTDRAIYGAASAICTAAAIVIKTNCEIALIALLMILLGSAWDGHGQESGNSGKESAFAPRLVKRIILAALFLAFTFGAKTGVDAYFCDLTGLDKIPDGNPAWAHIAMGLQESELEDGWFNGYNYRVFEENNYDTEATAAAARENISNTLSGFAADPGAGVRFFLRKFTTQWADPVCVSTHNLDLVSRHVENQPQLCDFLVFGKGSRMMQWVMNVFMTVCYLGVFVCMIHFLRKKELSSSRMLLLILIFGGICFHEFWEGSSRYAMRYYIYWLPYAACGLEVIFGYICKHKKR